MKIAFTPFPTLVFYSDIKGGKAALFRVIINKKKKNDKGIHAHEYRHVTHFYIMSFLMLILGYFIVPENDSAARLLWVILSLSMYNILVTIVPWFTLYAEIDCFRVQIKVNGKQDYIPLYADMILTKYDVPSGLDREWVMRKLGKK